MEVIRPRSWKGFIAAIERVQAKYGVHHWVHEDGSETHERVRILFRGQSDEGWALSTTLERKTDSEFHVSKYVGFATGGVREIEAYTGSHWEVADYPDLYQEIADQQDVFKVHLPCYDYLVYLRQHGFASPLLDWTESPYIAAYFAVQEAHGTNAVVYCYVETPTGVKGGVGGSPMITVMGPHVRTHKRHFAQKAWYTISTQWNETDQVHYFCPHERVFDREDAGQDLLIKIVLPATLRNEAMSHLSDYNINHFTLFQTEDSLIKAIEMKEFDLSDV